MWNILFCTLVRCCFAQIETTLSEMVGCQLFNPPDPLPLSKGNSLQNWTNYELATVIGDEALDVYNVFTWDSEDDKIKIDKVLEQFNNFCEPRRNTIYERYLFFSRGQESSESR